MVTNEHSDRAANRKVVLITGCSSGIGLSTAVYLAAKGCKVYATMRDLGRKDRLITEVRTAGAHVEVLQLDVTAEESVRRAVATVTEKEGRIDVLVNNAGFGSRGFLEDFSMEEIREQFETNLFGLIRVTQAVLPIMRQQRCGWIINISSIVGKMANPVSPIYSATKFAVEAITETSRVELAPFGIKVTAIEPPYVNTNFLNASKIAERSQSSSSPYYEYMRNYEEKVTQLAHAWSVRPLEVAKAVHAAITARSPRRSYPVGRGVRLFLIFKGMVPNRVFEWMLRRQLLGNVSSS